MPQQLLAALEKPGVDRHSLNCRIYERLPCSLPTTCKPASSAAEEMSWSATISDISQGGVRINLQRRFEKGTGLAIELPGKNPGETSVGFVRVVHLRRLEDGAWSLGCQFISALSEDELENALTVAHQEPPSGEAESPAAKILTDVSFQIAIPEGSEINCAIKRLDVAKCWPLTAGKMIDLSGIPLNQSKCTLRIKLIQYSQQGAGWKLAGTLVQTPAAVEFLQSLRHGKR
jgi:hypothetical protein